MKIEKRKYRDYWRGLPPAVLIAGSVLGVAIQPASAQTDTSPAQTADMETIVVTGSAIKGNPDVESSNPISVVGADVINRENSVNIQNVIQNLPSVGTQSLNSAESSNFGGNGFEYVDLRNLEFQRTLVLVDGQRFVSSVNVGGAAGVDLNNIPSDLIDHIEVLRDGASPIYGSDAVAGVINFILKKKYTGIEFNTSVGSTDKNDGTQWSLGSALGTTFDRGNIIISASHDKSDPVYQRDRPFAGNINGSALSSYFLGGHFTDDSGVVDLVGNGTGTFTPYTGGKFDTSKIPNLINGVERTQAYLSGNYNLVQSDDFPVVFSAQVMYTNRKSLGIANPDPQFATTTADALGITSVGPTTSISAAFRSAQIGNRDYVTTVDTHRVVVGFEGTVFDKYDWQLNYDNGVSAGDSISNNLVNEQVLGALDGSTYTAGNLNNLSGTALTDLRDTQDEKLRTQEDVWSAQISGPVVALPAGDMSFALGGDVRTESLTDTPGPDQVSGIVDQAATPTSGSYNLKEAFAELKIPLLKDMFLVKDLSIDGAARYSSYNTFGDAETWKATINYAPVDDIRFRATFSTAFRAPTIQELFLSNTQSYQGVTDSCDTNPDAGALRTTASGQALANVIANCNKALAAVGQNPATYSAYNNAQQILAVTGGNSKLTPETSRNMTVGTVITPSFLPDVQLTVDYWHVRIANQIIQLPDAQTAVDACYSSANFSSPTCATVGARQVNPSSSQVTAGGISQLVLNSINEGKVDTDGIDFGLDYNYNLAKVGLGDFGTFALHHVSTLTMLYQASDQTGTVNDNLGKLLSTTVGGGYPDYQARTSATIGTKDWSFTWSTRFIQGMERYTSSAAAPPVQGVPGDFTPDVWYHDISGTYTINKLNFVVGIQNLFDKQPPYFVDAIGRTNSNPYVYDYLGRFLYLKATIKL